MAAVANGVTDHVPTLYNLLYVGKLKLGCGVHCYRRHKGGQLPPGCDSKADVINLEFKKLISNPTDREAVAMLSKYKLCVYCSQYTLGFLRKRYGRVEISKEDITAALASCQLDGQQITDADMLQLQANVDSSLSVVISTTTSVTLQDFSRDRILISVIQRHIQISYLGRKRTKEGERIQDTFIRVAKPDLSELHLSLPAREVEYLESKLKIFFPALFKMAMSEMRQVPFLLLKNLDQLVSILCSKYAYRALLPLELHFCPKIPVHNVLFARSSKRVSGVHWDEMFRLSDVGLYHFDYSV